MKRFLLFFYLITSSVAYAEYCEVILLGTGTPRPSIDRFGAATLVYASGKYFLFDAGRGATIRLQQAGITPNQIEHIFLTHLHSDHISGLDDIWITGWVWQRDTNLQVYGPEGTNQLIDGLRSAYSKDISYRTDNARLNDENAKIESHEIEKGVVYNQSGVTIKTFLVDHKPVEPALGYRIEFGGRVIVISGDTTYTNSIVEQARDADVLVHEIAAASKILLHKNKRLQRIVGYHTNPEQMTKILQQTNPRLTALTHVLLFGVSEQNVLTSIKENYDGKVVIGRDLMKIDVGENISIKQVNE